MSSLPTVLFVCYGGGHVRMVLPVVREVQRRGLARPVILGLTSARAEVEAAGFECLGFADFVRAQDAAALAKGEKLAHRLQTHATNLRESAAYLGLSYADLVEDHGAAAAQALYAEHGRFVFLPVHTLQRIVRATGAAAVVATSAPRAERAAILAARHCGVPSLCMVDLFAAYEIEWLKAPGFADRVCVLNERVRDRLVAAGRDAGDIVVTGNPAFDRITDPDVRAAGVALRKQRGWEGQTVVLWASQVEPEHHPSNPGRGDPALPQRIADTLRAMLPAYQQLELVVRPHPSEPPAPAPAQPREWLSPRSEDLHALLHACDIVAVLTSTVGIEARLAGCHVIQVLGSLYSPDAPYLAYGIADQAVPLEQLPQAVLAGQRRVHAPAGRPQAARQVVDQLATLLAA
ncbi:MAG: UDP-glycosyltransferase [Burkholderiales bacterium]|nr:UDP-glycosyltransferase [Burkholderiales bacterium]